MADRTRGTDDLVKGQSYVVLAPDRTPEAFLIGGINRSEQVPSDAVLITRELHQQWASDTVGQALADDGLTLTSAPEKVYPLEETKTRASTRARASAIVESASLNPRRRAREQRVWDETVREARGTSGAFVAAYLAGSSTATTTAEAGAEILAAADSELANESATELVLQTALAAIAEASDVAAVRAVFPLEF